MNEMRAEAGFLYEIGILAAQPRSGFSFLRESGQSIAEHINRAVYIGLLLASFEEAVDADKVMRMCLFHDLAETRTLDLHHLSQKYVQVDEKKAVADTLHGLNGIMKSLVSSALEEYEERVTREAVLAKEADILELIVTLKEMVDTGNVSALSWIDDTEKRLKTDNGKKIAAALREQHFSAWWHDKDFKEWVLAHK